MGAQLSSPHDIANNNEAIGGVTDEDTHTTSFLAPPTPAPAPALIRRGPLSTINVVSKTVARLSPRRRMQKRSSQHDGRSRDVDGYPSPIKKKVDTTHGGGKKNNDVQGFDALAAVLSDRHNEFVSKKLSTVGILNAKFQQLRAPQPPQPCYSISVTTSSPQSVAGLMSPPAVVSPNHHHRDMNSSVSSPSSLLNSSTIALQDPPTVAPLILMSSTNLGVRRLQFHEILRLTTGNDFILVLPQPSGKRPASVSNRVRAEANSHRKPSNVKTDVWETAKTHWYDILYYFQKTVLEGIRGSDEELDIIHNDELARRCFQRDGQHYYELHLTIKSCSEQETLQQFNLPERTINNFIDKPMNVLGDGFYVQLYGHGTFLLRFATLPYVEIYVARKREDPYLDDSIGKFPRSQNEDTVLAALTKQLHATNGDSAATVQVMMGYYKHSCVQLKQQLGQQQQPVDETKIFDSLISNELTSEKLERFAAMVDNDYKKRMLDLYSNFSEATPYLISDEQSRHYLNELITNFPNCYRVLHTVAGSKKFPVRERNGNFGHYIMSSTYQDNAGYDETNLLPKERQILYAFYALLRTKSRNLLEHWSQVEPLARCFKGQQQPGGKGFAGSFHSTLITSLKKQEQLYSVGAQQMSKTIRGLPHVSGAFDNHNKIHNKKSNTDGKSAIAHIGTAAYLKQDRPNELLPGTKLTSPLGIDFDLTSCSRTEDAMIYTLKGAVTSMMPEDASRSMKHEKMLIETGQVEWPALGWMVTYMPGFTPRPHLTYAGQIVQPPQRAWIRPKTSITNLVLNPKRKLSSPISTSKKKSLDSASYFECIQLARRLVDINSHKFHLVREKEQLNKVYDEATSSFIEAISEASSLIAAAASFQKDIVQQINPNARTVDQMFLFPIIPYSETSKNEMKMTYAELGRYFELFEIDDRGKVVTVKGSEKRRINLCVDALSARNFRELEYNLTRKLGEMGASPYVKAMIDVLHCITIEHDYLHETRFHRLDCIYMLYYGAFLQPLQIHLGWKNINGDPVKNKIQPHEQFMWIVYNALRRHRFNQFIKNSQEQFTRQERETAKDLLIRLDVAYQKYCVGLEQSPDQPSRVAALFMKCVESYNRCFHGVRNADFWLMEIEGCQWLGAFKLCGKTNYVTETLHRMHTLYVIDVPEDMARFGMDREDDGVFVFRSGTNEVGMVSMTSVAIKKAFLQFFRHEQCKRYLSADVGRDVGNNVYRYDLLFNQGQGNCDKYSDINGNIVVDSGGNPLRVPFLRNQTEMLRFMPDTIKEELTRVLVGMDKVTQRVYPGAFPDERRRDLVHDYFVSAYLGDDVRMNWEYLGIIARQLTNNDRLAMHLDSKNDWRNGYDYCATYSFVIDGYRVTIVAACKQDFGSLMDRLDEVEVEGGRFLSHET
eukprot:scaffold7400_cov122-Skeletonema_menzelii.AAC.2